MSQDYEGIVVLGAPRSGTTLLRRLLNAHPNIACPPETNLLNGAARMLEEEPFAGGLSVGVLPGLAFSGYEREEVIARVREFVFSFFREARDRAGKARWAEKTAFDSFYIDAIEELCGDRCRYICVTRHALDQVCSVKELCDEMQMVMRELHRYVAEHAAPLIAFAHAWIDVNERLARFCDDHENWCVRVRYEDLVENPETELDRILTFLGEPTPAGALIADAMGRTETVGLGDWKTYKTSRISAGNVGRWKELPADLVNQIAQIANPMLQLLGYEPVETQTEQDAATSDWVAAAGLRAR